MVFEERKMQFELERLRLQWETDCYGGKGGKANQTGIASINFGGARFPELPHFIDVKNAPNGYLLQFERYTSVENWPQPNWQLS